MSKIFEQLVKMRGLGLDFLKPKYLSDAAVESYLPDMDVAIKTIFEVIEKQGKIMVYGDYDVDGVTATTLMCEALKLAGAENVITMLPDRFIDGYGMSERCLKRAIDEKVDLVVTVDCGSNNASVILKLKEAGIPVVVTDHHEIMSELPEAVAVVNPKRTDIAKKAQEQIKKSGLIDLAGVGVAFMVARGLVKAGKIKDGQEKWMLDLVVIGTLCDSMNLSILNRELTFYGMKVLEKTRRPGLKALMDVAKVSRLNAEAIGFQIGPRLNAGGRMESAEISLKLLMSESKAEALVLAEELNELNLARRTEQIEAVKEIEGKTEELSRPVIVVSGNWHEGVLGIIAGRLVERYHKPAFVLSKVSATDEDGDGFVDVFKGSGRSFGEFNLAEALKACKDSIYGGGGHAGACGLKVLPDKIDEFAQKINEYYLSLGLKDQERFLKTTPEISEDELKDFSVELLDELSSLEPFGNGNIEPIFELKGMRVDEARRVGKDEKHLRMVIRDKNEAKMTLIAFSAPEKWLEVRVEEKVNVVVQLTRNEWGNRVSVEGRILEIKTGL
jgi:single-stranded-DNA-specific exonuclease